MSIPAIFPRLIVKAMTENGFPSSAQTSPGAPLTSAGSLTMPVREKLWALRATFSAPRTSIDPPAGIEPASTRRTTSGSRTATSP